MGPQTGCAIHTASEPALLNHAGAQLFVYGAALGLAVAYRVDRF